MHIARCLLGLVAGSILGSTAHAAYFFTDHFDGPAFDANLVDVSGSYFFAGGMAGNGSNNRNYVRTIEDDYIGIDFQADLIYSIGGRGGEPGVFFGIGSAIADVTYFHEPDASLYLLDHTPSFPNSFMAVRQNDPGPGGVADLSQAPSPDGTSYLRITKVGSSLTLAFDYLYDGSSFVPDGSYTLDPSVVAPFLATGPSHLFFGTQNSPSRFHSLQVSAIPEPASGTLLGIGLLVLAGRRATSHR